MVEGTELSWDEIPAIQDKEVAKPEGDRFGHRDLELALRGLLESDKHSPPYSVGLLGRWGSGKSTVRALYEGRLEEDTVRSRRIRTISFDAWRFGKEEVKRALLRHVFLELGGDDSELRDGGRWAAERGAGALRALCAVRSTSTRPPLEAQLCRAGPGPIGTASPLGAEG